MKKLISFLLVFVLLCGTVPTAYAWGKDPAMDAANVLYAIGLARGSGTNADGTPNYDLDGKATREQALVMLIRLLGQEEQAESGWKNPFPDTGWADSYIGYAWEQGLTKGYGDGTFGTGKTVTAQQYVTFVLRALGYRDDAGGDFTYGDALAFAESIGLLTAGEYTNNGAFDRGDMFIISERALSLKMAGSQKALAEELVERGALEPSALSTTGLLSKELTAEQVFETCSPAVVYVQVTNGVDTCSGSGVILTVDGLVVTNHHVIDGMTSGFVRLHDGTERRITGIYGADADRDLAWLQIEGTGYHTVTIDSESPKTGAKVYAIGSPMGLENTISEGIVSSSAREIDGADYIQTTAPISQGSSGGALVNSKGMLVGITTAYIDGGQNLNLAVPAEQVSRFDWGTATGYIDPNAPVTITLDKSKITLETGEKTAIRVHCPSASDSEIHFEMQEVGFCVGSWSEWDGDYIDLHLTGKNPGTTRMRIWVTNGTTGATLGEVWADVTVEGEWIDPNAPVTITLDKTAASMPVNERVIVRVHCPSPEESTIHCERENSDVVRTEWMEWDGDYIDLWLIGDEPGTTRVRIWVTSNETGAVLGEAYVDVSVTNTKPAKDVLSLDSYNLTLKTGEQVVLSAHSTLESLRSYVSEENPGIACAFSGEWTGNYLPLYIDALVPGKTSFTVWVEDDAGNVLAEKTINVTVTGEPIGSGYYAYYPGGYPAPDFGWMFGVMPLVEDYDSEGRVMFYLADDLGAELGTMLEQYMDVLLNDLGFEFVTSEEDDYGATFYGFVHEESGVAVMLGSQVLETGEPGLVIGVYEI